MYITDGSKRIIRHAHYSRNYNHYKLIHCSGLSNLYYVIKKEKENSRIFVKSAFSMKSKHAN